MNASRIAAVALVLALPWLTPPSHFHVVAVSLVIAVAVLGQNVLVGVGGIASFAGAGFLALGAYAFGHVRLAGGGTALGIVAAVALSLTVGTLLGMALQRASLIAAAVSTVAFAVAVQQAIAASDRVSGGPLGIVVPPWPDLAGIPEGATGLLAGGTAVFFAALATRRILATPPGWALQASRDDPRSARAVGVDVPGARVWAFAWSSGVTGLAGALLAPVAGRLDPSGFSLAESMVLFTAVIVGGRGSVLGSVLGAFFVVATPVVAARAGSLVPAVFGGAVALVLWLAPEGLGGLLHKATRRTRGGAS